VSPSPASLFDCWKVAFVIIGADLLNVGNDSEQLGDGFERGGRATQTDLTAEGILEHDVDLFRESSVMMRAPFQRDSYREIELWTDKALMVIFPRVA
jgi:hypothetical protein